MVVSPGHLSSVLTVVDPDNVKDVLAVIRLYEDGDEDTNNALIDHETGLPPTTVDEVLDYLWRADRIEGIMTVGGRNPSLDSIRRVLPDRERLWGDDGRYRPHPRPELTVTEAAKAAGVDRRTIRRRLDADDFPNAHRDTGKQGPGSGPWLIPVEDLLAAGLKLHQPSGPDEPTTDTATAHAETEATLRAALADAVRRADVAEAVAAERERVIEAQALALRALRAGVDQAAASASDLPAPLRRASDWAVVQPAPRRWWQRRRRYRIHKG